MIQKVIEHLKTDKWPNENDLKPYYNLISSNIQRKHFNQRWTNSYPHQVAGKNT